MTNSKCTIFKAAKKKGADIDLYKYPTMFPSHTSDVLIETLSGVKRRHHRTPGHILSLVFLISDQIFPDLTENMFTSLKLKPTPAYCVH